MSNEDILISVVMTVYNTPVDWLRESVRSVLDQTHKNFEFFIVDDASDNTEIYNDEIFSDPRIKIILSKVNKGCDCARNQAIDIADGKYIAILDSDDICYPERFEKQIEFMEQNSDVVACGTWYEMFGNKNSVAKRVIDDNEYYRCCLLFGNVPTLLHPSMMLRKSTLNEHGFRYDERLRSCGDYKMWTCLSKVGKCTNLKEVLMKYRVHKNQVSEIYRSKGFSIYGWIIFCEQLERLGIIPTEAEEALLRPDFRSDEVDPIQYYRWLEKILAANRQVNEYNQEKLELRVKEQWISKIYSVKSVGTLTKLIVRLPFKQKFFVIFTEIKRVFKKIFVHKK